MGLQWQQPDVFGKLRTAWKRDAVLRPWIQFQWIELLQVLTFSVPVCPYAPPTTTVLKPFFSFFWLFVPFLGVDSPDFFLHSLLSYHRMPIFVLGSWHILPRFVFSSISQLSRGPYSSEAFFPEFVLFFCCRASSSSSLYNNVGGDNHVVTFSIDKRLWLVHKAGDVGGK